MLPQRDAGKLAPVRGSYRVTEDDGGIDIRGRRKRDPVLHLRRILVYCSANAASQTKSRALNLAKGTTELEKLACTARTLFHPTEQGAPARVHAIAAKRSDRKILAHSHHRLSGLANPYRPGTSTRMPSTLKPP